MDEVEAVARTELQAGWAVHDADGTPIGEIGEVGDTSFTVVMPEPAGLTVSVSFDDIESADQGRVDLSMTGEEIHALHAET